jgi:hypothetical protein
VCIVFFFFAGRGIRVSCNVWISFLAAGDQRLLGGCVGSPRKEGNEADKERRTKGAAQLVGVWE